MQNRFKFRALRDDMSDCNFYYGSLIYNESGEPRIQIDNNSFVTCIKGTECQFTGKLDINKKEIYESDIVKGNFYGQKIGIIKWLDDRCGFYIVSKTIGTDIINRNPFESAYKLNSCKIEVIGNLHENKELY
jgi:uncharacterized phage protein (TIGR01671 family)